MITDLSNSRLAEIKTYATKHDLIESYTLDLLILFPEGYLSMADEGML
jgi:hypothetical protein